MYLTLLAAGVVLYGAAGWLISAPGYMDAEYYMATASQIAQGKGLVEPFIWNYLSSPAGLPAASHLYWQPLASLVLAGPLALWGANFRLAQMTGILIAAFLPLLSARLAVSLGAGKSTAWTAGFLALLPGFFAPYLLTTDTFGLFAVIGGVLLWQVAEAAHRPTTGRWVALGALVALANLTRADGLLLWTPVLYAVFAVRSHRLRHLALTAAGFVLVMTPWWARNLAVTGAIVSPGATRALWVLNYDELFRYPADQLTAARWWAAGPAELLDQRLHALWTNLQSVVAVNGYVLLLPLMIVGGWIYRRQMTIRAGALYAAILFLFMSLVFPFAGGRGGFFHSSAALMPLLWALAAAGLEQAAAWVAPQRGWEQGRTWGMLASIALLLAAGLSAWALAGKAGLRGVGGSFDRNRITYEAAGAQLRSQAGTAPVVAVGDPPGFFLSTGLEAVAIPDGSEDMLQEIASKYSVDWVVLEADHPRLLDELYRNPSTRDWLAAPLTLLDPAGHPVYLFRVLLEGGA